MKPLLIVLVAAVLILQYRLWFADDGLVRVFRLKTEIQAQEEKNEEIEKHNLSLIDEIDSLKKGGGAIESRARRDLGMVKKGEVFYQVVK
ncbi:MAG: septum formation initiator family protein [Gammaproteobacteria bacterium]|nr:septum formation initiator family protein [Gammaproteobacteria bacterium]